ncbi:orexin/Hypocretin receptor type 1 isoform X4 [Equus quagga]|uniref:orexin/Hypocretin receptor type 1 isoform X4 n=1 Tax=Equus quagga TaxID=89248 RepID=UPI001EE29077|nr:orexin/Hypocretin receptor type 1 isoform X4 [Equus quagga]
MEVGWKREAGGQEERSSPSALLVSGLGDMKPRPAGGSPPRPAPPAPAAPPHGAQPGGARAEPQPAVEPGLAPSRTRRGSAALGGGCPGPLPEPQSPGARPSGQGEKSPAPGPGTSSRGRRGPGANRYSSDSIGQMRKPRLKGARRFGAGTPKTWVQDSGSPEGSGLRPVRAPLSPRSPGCPSSADSPELMEPSATPGAQTGVPSGSAEPSPLPPDYEDEFLRYLWRDYLYPKQYEWVLIAAYVAVFLVALVGNTLVCLAVWRNHHMRTVTNYFIVNLSLADVLVTAICLPASLLVDITESWLFGHALCKVIPYLQAVSVSVAVLTLSFIALDRWYAICHPLLFKSTARRARGSILGIWAVSLAVMVPQAAVMEYSSVLPELANRTRLFSVCDEHWADPRHHLGPREKVEAALRPVGGPGAGPECEAPASGPRLPGRGEADASSEEDGQDADGGAAGLRPLLPAHQCPQCPQEGLWDVPPSQRPRSRLRLLYLLPLAGVCQQRRQPHHLQLPQWPMGC